MYSSRMIKLLAFTLILTSVGCSPTELKDATLWTSGAWALYDQTRIDSDGTQVKGTFKVSAVGGENIDGKPYYWIEFREDNESGVKITKFLASETVNYDPLASFVFWDDVKRIIIQENSKTPEEVPAQHLKRYAPTFIESIKSKRFGNIKDTDQPQVIDLPESAFKISDHDFKVKGTKTTRKYTSSVNLGFLNLEDTTESSTEFFRVQELPFGGIVKVTHSSSTTSVNKLKPDQEPKNPQVFENTMIMTQYGVSGATSQIIGEPVEMKVLPFPFLKGGQSKAGVPASGDSNQTGQNPANQ